MLNRAHRWIDPYITWIAQQVTDFFAPPFCRSCKVFLSQRVALCNDCVARIMPVVITDLSLTAHSSMRVIALGAYREPLSTLVIGKSWADHTMSPQLAQLMWEHTTLRYQEFDYIVPIPLHWRRYAQRGYNQAYEIARVLSTMSGKPVANIVKRIRSTPFQSSLQRDLRAGNVTEAFVLTTTDSSLYKRAKFLLVDDLMTTGATLRAVAKELKKLQPTALLAVVGCKAG
jgi:ComF family protein